ncbi:hypothetical protein D3C71_1598660 [compost metagenome]
MGRQFPPFLQTNLQRYHQLAQPALERLAGAPLAQLVLQEAEFLAAITQQFSANEIQRLDAVSPFINLRDAAIAHQLLHAPLTDKPVTAVNLHSKAGDFLAHVGKE